ncbi:MAG: hypothetical protein ACKVTZ_23535 [Bacteroidia bacterium]
MILLLAISVAVLGGCKKPIPEFYFSEEFKAYTQFQVGSYWVFRDSISGEIDTVKWKESQTHFWLYQPWAEELPSCGYDKIKSEFLSNTLSNFWFISAATCEGYQLYENQGIPVFFINNPDYADKASQVGDVGYSLQKTTYINYFDSLKIKDKSFQEVRTFLIDGSRFDEINLKYYWAKNVGLIKFMQKDSSVWELINYKVSQ